MAAAALAAAALALGMPAEDRCTRIVVDPGHDARANAATEPIGPGSRMRKVKDGGGTSGVVSRVPEHVVTLRISLDLRRELVRRGYCVTMTRTRSAGVSLGNVARARIANRARAALFIRIHADGSTDRSRHGSSVLYPAFHREWTADVLPASRVAARLIQRELVRGLRSRDLGIVARRDITGFNWSDVPVVLPELGFMSNPREDRLLTSRRYQRRAARALARGIERFVAPRAAAARSGCRPAGSRTIVAGRQARVFTFRGIAYGCLYRRGVRVPLTNNDNFSESRLTPLRPRLSGRFVGYAYVWQNAVTGGDGVAVTDLRRGRTRYIELDATEEDDPAVSVRDLVVTPGGSLAWTWTAQLGAETAPTTFEVRKIEPSDSTRRLGVLLDSGPEIDLASLQNRGSTVSWLKGGERVSATLR